MVTQEHNHRTIGNTVSGQLLQYKPDLPVKFRGGIEILGPIGTSHRMIWVIRRKFHQRRIRSPRRLVLTMRLLEIDLSKERLVRSELTPAIRIKRLARIIKIPV